MLKEIKVINKRAFQMIYLFLGKRFNKSLKNLDIKWITNVQDKGSDISSQNKRKVI